MDERMESGSTLEEIDGISSTPPEGGEILAGGSDPVESSPELLRAHENLRGQISTPGAEAPKPSPLQQQLDELNSHIEEVIERKFQSGKDKRMVRLEREIKALNEEITELRARQKENGLAAEATNLLAKASHLIQPSGGGLPAPDLRQEYERRVGALRPGDVAGLMEVKREFRKRGLEVY